MELQVALGSVRQILDEERTCPTVQYNLAPLSKFNDLVTGAARLGAFMNLLEMRSRRPRHIVEDPMVFKFESVNYNLLLAVLSQVSEKDHQALIQGIAARMISGVGCARGKGDVYPHWNNMVSELPLVGEFLVRNGAKDRLFDLLENETVIPGDTMLMMQLEDMIALNYPAFTDAEYDRLSRAVRHFAKSARAFAEKHARPSGNRRIHSDVFFPEIGAISLQRMSMEISGAADGIAEQCRKARYLYLKGSLLEGLNLEVNQDKNAVESYLQWFGFTKLLVDSLNEVERLYLQQSTPFELKSCVGHLRSFLENLHKEAMPPLYAKFGGALPTKWGEGLAFLVQNNVL